MAKKIKRAKRTLTLEKKANLIISKMMEQVRYNRAITGSEAIGFTMRDIAKFTGYSASNKLMVDLYTMCDHGYLILDQEPIKKTGKAEFRNRFWLPESFAQRMTTKKMFKELA